MLVCAKSEIGQVRLINEDNYAIYSSEWFVVADGMGGHAAGEVASKLAVDTLLLSIESNCDSIPLEQLKLGITNANRVVFQQSLAENNYNGMGTTLTAIKVVDNTIYYGHVGDSRLYLFSQGQLRQLTKDHSLVWELMETGIIAPDEIQTHPQRNILTRAIGTAESIQVDLERFNWLAEDIVMLCTDGLTNMLTDQQINDILMQPTSLDAKLSQLISFANEAGGLDNITVILIQNEDTTR